MSEIIYRIPTGDDYAYIELKLAAGEVLEEGMTQEALATYKSLIQAFKGTGGLPDKEMNATVDTMLLGGSVEDGVELYEKMNDYQKFACQTIKRALKRIATKENN